MKRKAAFILSACIPFLVVFYVIKWAEPDVGSLFADGWNENKPKLLADFAQCKTVELTLLDVRKSPVYYTVQKGDTWSGIARTFGLSDWRELKKLNQDKDLHPDDVIIVTK